MIRRALALAALAALAIATAAGSASVPPGSLTQLSGRAGCIDYTGGPQCAGTHKIGALGGLVLSPDGKFVYMGTGGTVLEFRRDPATGELTRVPGSGGCLTLPRYGASGGCTKMTGVFFGNTISTISADGKTAYAPGSLEQHAYYAPTVVGFHRDPATGELTQFADPPACIPSSQSGKCVAAQNLFAYAPIVSFDGKNLYLRLLGGIWSFERDPSTGALTPLPDPHGCIKDPHFLPTLNLGCATGRAVYGPSGLAQSPDGKNVYVSSGEGGISIFSRDPATGALVQLPGNAGCVATTAVLQRSCAAARGLQDATDVTVSPDGRNVYAVSAHLVNSTAPLSHALAVFSRDPSTGALTQLPGKEGCVNDRGFSGCATGVGLYGALSVAVSPDGDDVYVASDKDQAIAVFHRDPRTGAVSQSAGTDACAAVPVYSHIRPPGRCVAGRLGIPSKVVVSSDGRNVYVGSSDNSGPSGANGAQIGVFKRA